MCYSCATGTPETRLVFVNLDTDTVEDCAHETFVIDPNTAAMTDAEREILETADHYGTFTDEAREIVRRVGVPFADLWAAYEWRRHHQGNVAVADLWSAYYWRRDMETAGILADVEDYVVRLHGERAGDGWRWRADRGGWTHCNDRAEYDDDGATCRKCYRFMSHDDAAARMIE